MNSNFEACFKAMCQATDATYLANDCIRQMGTLFTAIKTLTDRHDITNLCSLGEYVADDFGGLCEAEHQNANKLFEDLRQRRQMM